MWALKDGYDTDSDCDEDVPRSIGNKIEPYSIAMKLSKNDIVYSMFVKIYSPLLDSYIRANYTKMCSGCTQKGDKLHRCDDSSDVFVWIYGGSILDHIEKPTKKKAWKTLVDSIREANINSDIILDFMRVCRSPEVYITKYRYEIADIMSLCWPDDMNPDTSDDEDWRTN